jgi:hypothetical protein
LTYFALWLAAALAAIGVLSFFVVRLWWLHTLRCEQGLRMLDALTRYCEWVAAQRHAPHFVGESAEAARALDEACAIRLACFPDLAGDMAQLLGVHNRLVDFLDRQQQLRERDAEAWLESDHEGRFVALWHQQALVIRAIQEKLRLHDGLEPGSEAAPSTYVRPGLG